MPFAVVYEITGTQSCDGGYKFVVTVTCHLIPIHVAIKSREFKFHNCDTICPCAIWCLVVHVLNVNIG